MPETTFELISICPAEPGWRARFTGGGDGAIMAWGVFRKRQGTTDLGTSMEGIVADVQPHGPVRAFACAAAASNFDGYLSPSMP